MNFSVNNASLDLWGDEAIAFVQRWRFKPGSFRGAYSSVPVTVDLAWGPRDLPAATIARLRAPNPESPDEQTPKVIKVVRPHDPRQSTPGASSNVTVELSCIVGEEGVPRNIEVRKSPDGDLDQQAIAALAEWRFQPAILNGRPIAVFTRVQFTFSPPAPKKVK